jgi:hypothetical protein
MDININNNITHQSKEMVIFLFSNAETLMIS